MAEFSPRKIKGPWASGYVLDLHTLSSVLIGHDQYGHPQFDTKRSEIGELIFRLKYRSDKSTIPELVDAAARFIDSWGIEISGIVPIPPSRIYRTFQPVLALAVPLAERRGVPLLRSAIRKTKEIPELKNVLDSAKRRLLLEGAFEVNASAVQGQTLLIVDDLYRSGATMVAVAGAVLAGGASRFTRLHLLRRVQEHEEDICWRFKKDQ